MSSYLWEPPPPPSLPVRGRAERVPIHRIFCVGRNYHAHAVEMGRPVDKSAERPFYFTKSPHALVPSGATVPYPSDNPRLPLRDGTGGGDRQAGLSRRRRGGPRNDPWLRLRAGHDASRPATGRARQGPAMGPGQGHRERRSGVRSGADAGPCDHFRRDRAQRQRSAAPEVRHRQADLEHPRADRRPVAALSPATRRPDLHRHARRRGPGRAGRPHRRSCGGRRRDHAADRRSAA